MDAAVAASAAVSLAVFPAVSAAVSLAVSAAVSVSVSLPALTVEAVPVCPFTGVCAGLTAQPVIVMTRLQDRRAAVIFLILFTCFIHIIFFLSFICFMMFFLMLSSRAALP